MLVIGITGNIACGKSTVDGMLRELADATIIDADRVVHAVLRDDAGVRDAILATFGPSVLEADGQINRSRLGGVVFSDPRELRRLEAIVHPAVCRLVRGELAALTRNATAVIDAVKLLDGDLGPLINTVWWVTARADKQWERLIKARGLSETEARRRLAAQPRLDIYRDRVHVIIDNSGSLVETRIQVCAALESVGTILTAQAPRAVL